MHFSASKLPYLLQSQCIPLALQGRDICAHARTGSGKTLAFAIPVIQSVLLAKQQRQAAAGSAQPGVRAIVLVPTSELCDQVRGVFAQLLYYCTDIVTLLALSGGESGGAADADRSKKAAAAGVPMSAQVAQVR